MEEVAIEKDGGDMHSLVSSYTGIRSRVLNSNGHDFSSVSQAIPRVSAGNPVLSDRKSLQCKRGTECRDRECDEPNDTSGNREVDSVWRRILGHVGN